MGGTASWRSVETWAGAVNGAAAWYSVESWSGTVATSSGWKAVESWSGTVNTAAAWTAVESWAGSVTTAVSWRSVETWTGIVLAPMGDWILLETWTGVISAPAVGWRAVESWAGTVNTTITGWKQVDTWAGAVTATAQWRVVETWTGKIFSGGVWLSVESWSGAVTTTTLWKSLETWTGTVATPLLGWRAVESWTGTVNAPGLWKIVESWTGSVNAASTWRPLETWTGTVRTLGAPTLISPPNGTLTNDNTPTFDWTDITGASEYQIWVSSENDFDPLEVNTFVSVSTYTSAALQDNVHYWRVRSKDGPLFSPWSEVYMLITDTTPAPAPTLLLPENNTTVWLDQPLFTWTAVAEPNVTYWIQIDNDNDFSSPVYNRDNMVNNWRTIENKLLENFSPYYWRVASVDNARNENWSGWFRFMLKVQPASSVTPISPYWDNTSPRTVTATASDNDGVVENVELWYRYSVDNLGWGSYLLFGVDNNGSNGWSWTFTFDNGEGFYQFYSRAWDDRANYENAPDNADTGCGYDFTAPTKPTLLSPENYSTIRESYGKPTFTWVSSTDNKGAFPGSGITYRLVVDNDNDFSSPVYNRAGITDNWHALENSLPENVYYWRVTAYDGSFNENTSDWFRFMLKVPPVSSVTPISPYWKSSSPITMGVTASDNDGVVENVELWYMYSVDNLGWGSWTLYDYDATSPYSFTFLLDQEGFYQFYSRAWDDRANYENAPDNADTGCGYDFTAPTKPTLLSPENYSTIRESYGKPTFTWVSSTDNKGAFPGSGITYRLVVDNDNDFSSPVYNRAGITDNWHALENSLPENVYYWRVTAYDGSFNENTSDWFRFMLKVPPVSSVTPISPYWKSSSPITMGVTASDNDGVVENVELWYMYSVDNLGWGSWTLYDYDATSPYSFTFLLDQEGFYQFYSRAWDDRANYENAPDNADTGCGYDFTAPGTPTPISPENGSAVTISTPMFTWTSVSDLSVVVYELVIDDENSFTAPHVYHKTQISENSHTVENSLGATTFYWRLRAVNGAGLAGSWSGGFTFTVTNVWREVETWTGTVNGTTQWRAVETWSGTITTQPTTGWQSLDSWSGTVITTATLWKAVETWTGTVSATGAWKAVDTWTGVITTATNYWSAAETWTGTVQTTASWRTVDSWAGTVTATTIIGWSTVETWAGSVATHALAWGVIETWSGVLTTAAGWKASETWSGTVQAVTPGWLAVEGWTGTASTAIPAPALISPSNESSTGDSTPTFDWDNTTPVDNFELWVDDDVNFSSPVITTTATASEFTPGASLSDGTYYWRVRSFRGGENSAWSSVWSLTITTAAPPPPPPPPPPAADFSISASPTTSEVSQGGSTQATITVTPSGGYSYTVSLSATGQPSGVSVSFTPENGTSFTSTMSVVVSRYTQVGSHTITVTGKGTDGKTHTLTFTLKVTELPVGLPTSSVSAIAPFWQVSIPFTVTAAASDNDGSVASVTLYYRYSTDNSIWDNWVAFGTDTAAPWSWSFTAPRGQGYYEFYSVARDNENNIEPTTAQVQARCGIDTTPPAAPRLLAPLEISNTGAPKFDWPDISDFSGVSYTLEISTGMSMTTLALRKTGVSASEYSLSALDILAAGMYYWRARAQDGAGNLGAWSETRALYITSAPVPTATIERLSAGGIGTLDFGRYNIFITKVTITARLEVAGGEAMAAQISIEEFVQKPEWASALENMHVYRYFGIVSSTVTNEDISSARIGFRVTREWVAQRGLDENTVRLYRWDGSSWENLSTRFQRADSDFMYFEAESEGLSLFAAAGEKVETLVIVPLPPFIIYALLTMFGVIGVGFGYWTYMSKIRRIPQVVPLKRLAQTSRPTPAIPKPIIPTISVEMLRPAPVTATPGVTAEATPIPIATPAFKPKVTPPAETLTALKKIGAPARAPSIPRVPGAITGPAPISLTELAKVVRPVAPATSLDELARITKGAPAIPVKSLQVTVKPVEPAVALEMLKRKIETEQRTDGGTFIPKAKKRRQKKR
ncbi:MAG: PGF-pre-PGF domain-containing protein [Candidatus Hadarchaeota archaeon]